MRKFTRGTLFFAALMALMARALWAQEDKNKPYFLVATTKLTDSLFEESVVLMFPITQSPIVEGLIINKPTGMAVRKVLPNARELKNEAAKAFFGGPVDLTEPSILFRSAKPPSKTTELLEDLYTTVDGATMAHVLKNPGTVQDLRFYVGKSRWTEDQLTAEVFEGSWYKMPAETAFVFSENPKSVWNALVQRGQLQKASRDNPLRSLVYGFSLFPLQVVAGASESHDRFRVDNLIPFDHVEQFVELNQLY